MANRVREAIFEHEMFEVPARRTAYGTDSIRRNEATWEFASQEIVAELEEMKSEGLVKVSETNHWDATPKGLLEREQLWHRRGLRHPALLKQDTDLGDLILALIISAHNATDIEDHSTFLEDTLPIYLWKFQEQEISSALEQLVSDGYVRKVDYRFRHYLDENLYATTDGRIRYAQRIVPSLGLTPPSTILNPLDVEELPFGGIGLTPTFADNLRYRWEEASRCIQARAWLAASTLYGSIVEAVLVDALSRNKEVAFRSPKAPRDKSGVITKVEKWRLETLLDVACDLGWIDMSLGRYGHALRDLRNQIHASKQLQERSNPNERLVEISRLVTSHLIEAIAIRSKGNGNN